MATDAGMGLRHQKKIEKIFSKADGREELLCPIKDILHQISDKWAVLVMLKLGQHGTLRFGELRKQVDGISQKMLTETLRNLEQNGLLTRRQYAEIPPRVEYTITERGEGFLERLLGLVDWAFGNTEVISRERQACTAAERAALAAEEA